ncbi:hypothetical protein [Dyella sp. C9]|uniref:hypothetical protein n=1 Tax=Dyella sp. C9 TaxID=2202154 RepID=UPI0013007B47|nr:hypothetical protein [Dyella sp. C9]
MKSQGLVMSMRRVAAWVVTLVCHLVLLVGLLRPAGPSADRSLRAQDGEVALKLRFLPRPRPAAMPSASPEPRPAAAAYGGPARVPVKARVQSSAAVVPHVAARPVEPDSVSGSLPPVVSGEPVVSGQSTDHPTATGDGGFRERVLNAQHGQNIHGVPGSDQRVAPGIELANPMDQGIGSVVRNAQRLFGVTSRQCIDVEAWQQLTPEELSARHLDAQDVAKAAEKYQCNRPLGLNF